MSPHICIIGAGVSGLRCADILLQNDCQVTIIEARNRIGGRITQSDELGFTLDIGANWVHSTGSNPVVELAKATDTPLHLWEHTTCLIDGAGKLVDNAKANATLDRVWSILEEASEYSKENTENIDPSKSLYDFFVDQAELLRKAGKINEYEHDLLLGMAEMWGAYVGDRAERQSLKYFFLEDCIEGDDLFIAANYSKIVDKIAEMAMSKATIQFQQKMAAIQPCRNPDRPGVTVITTDGREQGFDDVVVTTPLGWLKRNKHALNPLTPRLSQAIDSVSFGRLEKVFIQFSHAFWDASPLLPNGTLSSGSSSPEPSPSLPTSFMHWVNPSYTPETNPSRWRLETVSFAAFSEQLRRPVLLFYTFGDCSTHITSLIHGLVGQARHDVLNAFFHPYYSRLPNYDPKTCKAEAYLATEWCRDELAGYGSYSNFQIGISNAAEDVKCMRHGMPEHHIWLAGEHTAPFDGLGTVSGSYNSGEAVAQRILQIHKDSGSREPFNA